MLKLDSKLYKYMTFSGFVMYRVIAIKKLKNMTLYEIECKTCEHGGTNCTMYVSKIRGKEIYKFVEMTNEEDHSTEHHIMA